jgi:hypothetical protein
MFYSAYNKHFPLLVSPSFSHPVSYFSFSHSLAHAHVHSYLYILSHELKVTKYDHEEQGSV